MLPWKICRSALSAYRVSCLLQIIWQRKQEVHPRYLENSWLMLWYNVVGVPIAAGHQNSFIALLFAVEMWK